MRRLLRALKVAVVLLICTELVLIGAETEFLRGQGCGTRAEISTKVESEVEANQCDFFVQSKQNSETFVHTVSLISSNLILI